MGKLRFGRVLETLCLSSSGTGSCLCISNHAAEEERERDGMERKPLIAGSETEKGQLVKIKDVISAPPTLAFQLKPKMVVLRVSMHCNGCARKVKKHISKMEGVTSYEIDLETKMVVVTGDIVPFEVLESVSKVMKTAELLTTPAC